MSLTSFVKTEMISHKIDVIFPKPGKLRATPLLAPPNTKSYMLVGTAFDYIMRFWLMRNYPNAEEREWVANSSIIRLGSHSSFLQVRSDPSGGNKGPMFIVNTTDGKQQSYPSIQEALGALPSDPEAFHERVETIQPSRFKMSAFDEYCLMKQCESIIKTARERVVAYCNTGEMIDELLMSALDLARMDGIFRSMTIPDDLKRYDAGDVQDLRRLYNIIPEEEFLGHDRILLNPTFGQASLLVGGADADLILDGRLINIKTTKSLEINKNTWRQIIGYGILADLARVEDGGFPKIDEIGVYFSRHGKLWTFPTSQIYKNEKYNDFREFFVDNAASICPLGGLVACALRGAARGGMEQLDEPSAVPFGVKAMGKGGSHIDPRGPNLTAENVTKTRSCSDE